MLSQLHFLQPYWFLALIPLAIVWWFMSRTTASDSKAWAKVIDPKLLPLLLSGSNTIQGSSCILGKSLLAIGWIIATFALADPVWEKVPRPVFQTNTARVIVLDLSSSMLIADLKPSRLARARFKIEDILSEDFTAKEEGQIGLVLFAGDAFTASPLTRDVETIRALLEVLTPSIMPSQGSRVDLGLKKAYELLLQAGVNNGKVLLIADGVSDIDATLDMANSINRSGHSLSVIGVGTKAGGILPAIKYRNGENITVKLEADNLQKIAQKGGGKYHLISTNNTDLQSVLGKPLALNKSAQEKSDDVKGDDWKSTGPFILLLLLPLAALAFRRGWLFSVLIAASFIGFVQPQPAMATPSEQVDVPGQTLGNIWNKLWKNNEQLAAIALQNKQYDKAKKLSTNPMRLGTANYKNEDYEAALKYFKQASGASAHYNSGNVLAKLEKYKEAIEAYNQALKLQPNMDDAKKNKSVVEKLLKQKKHKKADSKKDQKNGESKKEGNDKKNNKGGKPNKDGKEKNDDSKQGSKGEEDKKNSGKGKKDDNKSDNQFSEANKKLEQNKKEEPNEEEQIDKVKNNQNKSKNEKQETKSVNKKGIKAEADELNKEEKMAAEQWIRRIPDDPGGLLRRKFKYQYKQRRNPTKETQPW